MRVESVRPAPAGPPLVEVALAGGEVLRVHERRLAGAGPRPGVDLDPDRLDALRRFAIVDAAERRALRLIGRRARSRAELARRLVEWGLDAAEADATLDRLSAVGLVDDAALAGAVAESRRRQGHGRLRIAADLDRLAVEPEAGAAALADPAAEAELDRARRELERRFGGAPHDRREVARAAAHLARRGFDADTVAEALGLMPDA